MSPNLVYITYTDAHKTPDLYEHVNFKAFVKLTV